MKTTAKFIVIPCLFAGLVIFGIFGIHHMVNASPSTMTALSAPATDEIKVDRSGDDLVYMYHIRDGKIVDFGEPSFVMSEAQKVAMKNHSRVLSINPDYGQTFGGAQVTAGVYIVLSPVKD